MKLLIVKDHVDTRRQFNLGETIAKILFLRVATMYMKVMTLVPDGDDKWWWPERDQRQQPVWESLVAQSGLPHLFQVWTSTLSHHVMVFVLELYLGL